MAEEEDVQSPHYYWKGGSENYRRSKTVCLAARGAYAALLRFSLPLHRCRTFAAHARRRGLRLRLAGGLSRCGG